MFELFCALWLSAWAITIIMIKPQTPLIDFISALGAALWPLVLTYFMIDGIIRIVSKYLSELDD